jgi:outer membrane lipoprotein carrier protein
MGEQRRRRVARRAGGAGRALMSLGSALPLLWLGAAPGHAGAADPIAEARLLEARLNGVQGLVASFTQVLESPSLPSPQVERGTVYLLRPGRMRWEYDDPAGKLAISDGQRTWLYLPDEHRVLVSPLPAEGRGSGLSLLLRERFDLLADFSVTWGRELSEGGARPLVLTPRVSGSEYERLEVLTDDRHLIREFAVVDSLGSRVVYRFGRPRLVSVLDESLFRFAAPQGVEVQEISP